MIAFTGFLLVVLIAMLAAPATSFAQMCHHELVERPVSALAKFRSHHLIYALILIPVVLSGSEFIAILGPEFFAAYAMELAIYCDAVIVTLAVSAWKQVKTVTSHVAMVMRLPQARARRKRSAAACAVRTPANDDDDPERLPLAA
ncbi:hypothetical protein GRI62_09375 [Erythrobacter arachoides]|uniref:Uncharacterized protein n=1 Tax=Aurantiacibacter arachoides TaxID=1850444 RepID=A0A845A4H2_9SPHN|nr:hypothetical protein [Aurantiacibacter arachoides]MXO93817.1 hypothetical protein [Aurantiacibacter arachoides]GGD46459.1 hypothetical protein GCM10011411_02650 [Aurantiacibacter arachoides]